MSEEGKHGQRIFWRYAALIAILAGFNIYLHVGRGSVMSLVVAGLCILGLIGWSVYYFVFFRRQP